MLDKPLVVEFTPLFHICVGRLQSKSQALGNDVWFIDQDDVSVDKRIAVIASGPLL